MREERQEQRYVRIKARCEVGRNNREGRSMRGATVLIVIFESSLYLCLLKPVLAETGIISSL